MIIVQDCLIILLCCLLITGWLMWLVTRVRYTKVTKREGIITFSGKLSKADAKKIREDWIRLNSKGDQS